MTSTQSPAATLRTSNYTVYVDLPGDADHMILLHGYSGVYDKVSRAIGEYVRSLDVKPPKPLYGEWSDAALNGPAEAPSEELLEILKRRGYLTTLSREEERQRFDRVVDIVHRRTTVAMPNYILMPTYDCNLRCAYCFQDHMRTDRAYRHLLRHMTPKLIDRIVGVMPEIEARQGLTGSEEGFKRFITLFGGEPLLAHNRKMIEYLLDTLRSKSPVDVSVVSNATELDAYEDMLGPGLISAIQITLDGPPDAHDSRRIYADGSGSFWRIADNIDLALSKGVHIDIRMNVDRRNIDSLPELASVFEERGWSSKPGFSAYVSPVHAANDNVQKSVTFNSHELNEALRELKRERPEMKVITTKDDGLRSHLRSIFKDRKDPTPHFRASFCGAHTTMHIFDALGDIYACWERTGDKNLRIGWIEESGKLELVADRLAEWRSRTVASNDTCGQCRYAMYCGGGCAVLAEELHGTMFGNYCDAFARRFRTAVGEAYNEFLTGTGVEQTQLQSLRAL